MGCEGDTNTSPSHTAVAQRTGLAVHTFLDGLLLVSVFYCLHIVRYAKQLNFGKNQGVLLEVSMKRQSEFP